jgi:hypothetical protein
VNSSPALFICDFIPNEFSFDASSTVPGAIKEALNRVMPDRDEFPQA